MTIFGLVLLLAACESSSESGGSDTREQSGNAVSNDDSGSPQVMQSCDPDQAPAFPAFAGQLAWSEADLSACDSACPGFEAACVTEGCPGYAEFLGCFRAELNFC